MRCSIAGRKAPGIVTFDGKELHEVRGQGDDRKELAKRSVDTWARMVFEDRVFHADPIREISSSKPAEDWA